jgi:prepilin-type N-terminal cleavage/methylation domain-containing protein
MRRRSPAGTQAGFTLVELLVVLVLLGGLLLWAARPLLEGTAALRLRLAAAEVVGTLRSARAAAVRHDAYVAVKFRTRGDGAVTFALYRDGDGDGAQRRHRRGPRPRAGAAAAAHPFRAHRLPRLPAGPAAARPG